MHWVADHDDEWVRLIASWESEPFWCSLAAALQRAEQPRSAGPEDFGVTVVGGG